MPDNVVITDAARDNHRDEKQFGVVGMPTGTLRNHELDTRAPRSD
jgi:hypothetical protein